VDHATGRQFASRDQLSPPAKEGGPELAISGALFALRDALVFVRILHDTKRGHCGDNGKHRRWRASSNAPRAQEVDRIEESAGEAQIASRSLAQMVLSHKWAQLT
jgi:hypothetical protein